jgi:hypothetical protein
MPILKTSNTPTGMTCFYAAFAGSQDGSGEGL